MQHGPRFYTGPRRGSRAWWKGTQGETPPTPAEEPNSPSWKNDPEIRQDLVERIRKEIAAGNFDTPGKWEESLDRLLDRMSKDE